MNDLEIKDRILRFLTSEKLSSSKFADIIGVQRSSISHILSGRNKPSLDFLQKVLSNFPSINSDWLIVGNGEMFKNIKQTEISFETKKESPISTEKTLPKPETNDPTKQQVPTIATKKRMIKKVVVFYNDNTFEELNPNKTIAD